MNLLFQFTRIFGFKEVKEGGELSTLYLTHLAFAKDCDEHEVARQFISFLIKDGALRLHHMISYCSQSLAKPKGFIMQKTAIDLFCVNPTQAKVQEEVSDYIDFEMAIV